MKDNPSFEEEIVLAEKGKTISSALSTPKFFDHAEA